MARIRSIKPEFWTSEQVMECSAIARLMFIGMWNFADDLGRLPYSPKSIKAQIFPSDDITLDTILGMVLELSANGLILIYTAEDKEFLQITGWQHQRIDKPQPGKCPPPVQDHSTNVPGTFPPDRIGKEGKGEDTKGEDTNQDARTDLQKRVGNFRQAIVKAFEDANSPTVIETSRAELWLTQGFQEDICLAVIAGLVRKKPSITTLNYFDNAIKDAHACKAPERQAVPMTAEQVDWDAILATYKKIGHWSKWAGPDLTSPACRAPRELLEKYGLLVDGRTLATPIVTFN